ncbi:MAG: cytochrome b5-like heme/steroid binding domain-containing protein [Candidatus Woesearchaeota archaeon]|jgi:cytochrome b involved in lipid metabolism
MRFGLLKNILVIMIFSFLLLFIVSCKQNPVNNVSLTADNAIAKSLNPNQDTASVENKNTNGFSLTDVSFHNTANDCYMIIDGKVYDVISYVSSHPGGKAILMGCGKDATQLFETRPSGSGTPHSSKARELLNQYYIGDLIK